MLQCAVAAAVKAGRQAAERKALTAASQSARHSRIWILMPAAAIVTRMGRDAVRLGRAARSSAR
jgi:hypothetical protein